MDVLLAVKGPYTEFGRVIAEGSVFEISIENIQPEPIHALAKPEAEDIQHRLADLRVAPVQVGLFLIEHVVIVLAQLGGIFPGGAAEDGSPVVWRFAIRFWIEPKVPVMIGVFFGFLGGDEPVVLVRGMVENQVHNDVDVPLFGFPDKFLEIRHGAKFGVNTRIVGHIITKVYIG